MTVRVYAVTVCLHQSVLSTPTRCLIDGDVIPPASLLLLGSAPAASGSLSFKLAEGETGSFGWLPGGGPEVDAIVIQAVDAHGGSLFAIVASSTMPSGTL